MDPRITGPFENTEWLILAHAGSNAHGTVTKQGIDDIDFLGAYIPPKEYIVGLRTNHHWVWQQDELDVTAYNVQHLVHLWLKSNPNVLGLLWTEPSNIVYSHREWEFFWENRDAFLSKRIYKSFVGYAKSQMKKMTHEQKYQGYMGERRKKLVDTYGYDTKNACHLIRILRLGIEALVHQEIFIDRTHIDAHELMEIKQGLWTLEEVQDQAEYLFQIAEEALQKSKLPEHPDFDRAENLLMDCLIASLP